MRPTSTILLVTGAALALAACSKKAPEALPPAPADTTQPTPPPPPAQTGVTPGSQADFLASVAADHILFDTDQSDVDAEDQAILRSQAEWLMRYPNKRATLEGHADERGTREYNLALGDRRANAAKNYLAGRGINPARISTISYGKERPIALGSDEQSWAQNRRAVTIVLN